MAVQYSDMTIWYGNNCMSQMEVSELVGTFKEGQTSIVDYDASFRRQ
jgi:hypothetical protein